MDGPTDQPTDGWTKQGVESCSTQLKIAVSCTNWAAALKNTGGLSLFVCSLVRPSICPSPPPPLRDSIPSLETQIPAWKFKSQPWDSNPSLEAQIPVSRPKSQPGGSNPSLKAQIPDSRLQSLPWGSNPNLKNQIQASRLKSQPQDSNPSFEA